MNSDRRQYLTPLERQLNRRSFLASTGSGIVGGSLATLMQRQSLAEHPAITGQPNFQPKAKNVIWLFMRGGISHIESFDPKPAVTKYAGKSISETPWKSVQDPKRLKKLRVVATNQDTQRNKLYELQVGFKKYGQSGIEVSNFFPNIGSCIDDIAVVRSMWTTDDNHGAQYQFESGRHNVDGFYPTIGAWITYGLDSLNSHLPAFIKMGVKYPQVVNDGNYLGPAFDAVRLNVDPNNPLPYAKPELDLSTAEQQAQFGLIRRLNQIRAAQHPEDSALSARIKSYELAYRMQTSVPEVINFDDETLAMHQMYGLDNDVTKEFGQQLLAARRFVEKGVRFVKIMHGPGAAGAWDAHGGLKANHTKLAAQVDKPIAGLLKDLKQRGLLDETIVVFATEFGRTPGSQGGNGRDHHPFGFSVWLAGGGLKGGVVHCATDEIGFHAEEDPHYVTDIHATLCKQLGLESHQLNVPGHQRLELDYGTPIDAIIA